jgi:transposase
MFLEFRTDGDIEMATSKLTITHPDITHSTLDAYLSRRCIGRVKLRIAILQGVMDRVPIECLSRQRKMSRQGIYNLVKRINKKGIQGLEDQHLGRPGKLTSEIAEDLKKILSHSPKDEGYVQPNWNNQLLRRYLKEKHSTDIGRAQLVNWLNAIGTFVKLARKKYEKTASDKPSPFVTDLRIIQDRQPEELILCGNEGGAQLEEMLIAQWAPEGYPPNIFAGGIRLHDRGE